MQDQLRSLKGWRQDMSKTLQLEPGLVASNTLLKAMAKANPSSIEELSSLEDIRHWQVHEFGEAWVNLLSS